MSRMSTEVWRESRVKGCCSSGLAWSKRETQSTLVWRRVKTTVGGGPLCWRGNAEGLVCFCCQNWYKADLLMDILMMIGFLQTRPGCWWPGRQPWRTRQLRPSGGGPRPSWTPGSWPRGRMPRSKWLEVFHHHLRGLWLQWCRQVRC